MRHFISIYAVRAACFGACLCLLPLTATHAQVTQTDVNNSVNQGVAFLLAQQGVGTTGGWTCWESGFQVGITALAMLAIINSEPGGYSALAPAEKQAVDDGVACLLTKVQSDGSIADAPTSLFYYVTYSTSIAIWALSEGPQPPSPAVAAAIAGGRAWLLKNQYNAPPSGWDANCGDGGWLYDALPYPPYPPVSYPEHSNSSFALQGLAATGGVPGALTFPPASGSVADLAQHFFKCLQRGGAAGCGSCNFETGVDGGFTYTQVGGTATTNETGSGVFALRLTGMPATDPAIVNGLSFLDVALFLHPAGSMGHNTNGAVLPITPTDWSINGDPGHYGPWAAEKAYKLSGVPSSLTDPNNWYYKLANGLLAEQNGDGSWPTHGREDLILSTSFSLLALLQVATKPPCCVPHPQGMVAWWPLDEPAGTLVADIAGSPPHNGSSMPGAISGPIFAGPPGPTSLPAKVNRGLVFCGPPSPKLVTVADNAALDFGTTGNFSIDAWIQLGPGYLGGLKPIVDKLNGPSPSNGYGFYVNNQNYLELDLGTSSYAGTTALIPGNWYHVAVTVDRMNQVVFYVNGTAEVVGGNTTPFNASSPNLSLVIGGMDETLPPGAGCEYAFILDEIEVFNRALDVSEVQSISAADTCGKCKPQCFATGDINGNGVPLEVADFLYLIRFLFLGGPPPSPLYQGDLNGDGFIDQADIDILLCYFKSPDGILCFPVYPVPTNCNPDTVRGCCLTSAGNFVRSPANCALLGGTYQGDGTSCLSITCIDTVSALNGQQVAVPIVHESGFLPFGGFDLLVTYDQSALTFVTATRGALLDSLKWEYFTFRTGVNSNCGSGCPSGLVHLIAIADLDNGPQNHPIIGHEDSNGRLAVLQFRVSSDRNLIGQCVPVRFYWNDCGDNTFSSVSGDTTYFDHWILDPLDNLLWDEDDDVQFPESARPQGLGAPDSCLTGSGPGKPAPQREIDFCNGWVCIRPPIDDRGDINQNGVANEIGDAVLFSNFFIYGIDQAFAPPGDQREAQKLATDVNDDGVVLTIADLVYLIRIITGDAQPFPAGGDPKLTPYQQQAGAVINVGADHVTVTANSPVDLGGAVFTFRYSGLTVGTPVLSNAASQMVVKSNAERGELRVLIAPMVNVKGARIGAGINEILSIPTQGTGTIELVEVQMSDAQGNLLTTSASKSVPTEYTLMQNYPNPFNAGTIIQFGLKDATDWKLNVYNINGQTVRAFSGNGQGQVKVAWDGTDNSGRTIASGVYFYRLETKAFTATKKMTLVK